MAAALDVLPVFKVRAFRIVKQENIVVPGAQVAGPVCRPKLCRVPGIVELGVVAQAGTAELRLQGGRHILDDDRPPKALV